MGGTWWRGCGPACWLDLCSGGEGGRGVVVMLICTALASPSTSNICSELDQKKVDIDVIVQYIIIIR